MRKTIVSFRFLTALTILAATPAAHASLLSYWTFNEGSGNTAFDSVGSVNGTLTGTAAFVGGGVQGGAVQLSSGRASGFVDMGDNFNFTNLSSYSIQIWVQLAVGDTNGYIPVARHFATVQAGYYMGLGDTGDGCSNGGAGTAHFYSEYPCTPLSSVPVNDGQWHQLVGTFSGGVASLYVDGQFQGASSGTVLNPISGVDFMVGAITVGGVKTASFTGLADNVGIWDNALTAPEVAALYSSQVPEPATYALIGGALALLARRARRR